jgi:hypothetical protein
MSFDFPYEDITPPIIDEPTQDPADNVQPDQQVKISVNVTDTESGVKNVTLHFTNDTTWYDVSMIYNYETEKWEAIIPANLLGTNVTYWIEAYDNNGNHAIKDNEGHYYLYTVVPEFPSALMLIFLMMASIITMLIIPIKSKIVKKPK